MSAPNTLIRGAARSAPTKQEANSQRRSQRGKAARSPSVMLRAFPMLMSLLPTHPKLKGEATLSDRLSIADDTSLAMFHRMRRGLVRQVLGTQQPIFLLRSAIKTITASVSTIADVIPVDPNGTASILDWSSWKAVFDEYRVLRARCHIVNEFAPPASSTASACPLNWTCWCVDYDDATALGSVAAAMSYDTFKPIPLCGYPDAQFHTLDALMEGIPDLQWVTTATTVPAAWFKVVNANATAGNLVYYSCYLEYEIEFRQVD